MTDKELRKLRRGELLDLLIYQTEQNRKLREQLDSANDALARRNIAIEKSGSMAEASVLISEVFESADRAAKLYLENIEKRKRETDDACKEKLAQAEREAKDIVAGANADFVPVQSPDEKNEEHNEPPLLKKLDA